MNIPRWTAPDGSLVALVDCDTFYASCERVARPDLWGRPIVVLSNNDGCLVAMSREAKKLGLPMGEPAYSVRDLLLRHNVAVFSSNYALYGDLSRRVMRTISTVLPHMEVYSIDEAFAILNRPLAVQASEAARFLKQRIWRWIGLPVSIGIAPTKVLAKIATKVAKKNQSLNGVFDLSAYKCVDELLAGVPVRDLWGVGRKGALRLRVAGIHNALQFRDAEPDLIRKLLTVRGLNMLMELRGIPAIREEIPLSHSCIISSRSLGYKVSVLQSLEEAVAFHASRAAEKLRQKHLLAQMVAAGIQTAYYDENAPQHSEIAWVAFERPSLDTAKIIAGAIRALRRIYKTGFGYAKVMVMLSELVDPAKGQHDLPLLSEEEIKNESRRTKLFELVDKINRTNGRGTLYFASQGKKNADWYMKRDKLSPAWTTDISQLLKVGGKKGEFGY